MAMTTMRAMTMTRVTTDKNDDDSLNASDNCNGDDMNCGKATDDNCDGGKYC